MIDNFQIAKDDINTTSYRGLRAGLARDESLRRARIATASAGVPARDRLAFVLHGAAAEPVRALIAAGSGR